MKVFLISNLDMLFNKKAINKLLELIIIRITIPLRKDIKK